MDDFWKFSTFSSIPTEILENLYNLVYFFRKPDTQINFWILVAARVAYEARVHTRGVNDILSVSRHRVAVHAPNISAADATRRTMSLVKRLSHGTLCHVWNRAWTRINHAFRDTFVEYIALTRRAWVY